jgi:hypothetical protein
MRLTALLAELPVSELERLGAEHLGQDDNVTPATLAGTLEGVLKSYSFVRKFISDRMPPTFAILETLLEADGFSCPAGTFRDFVTERTRILANRVETGDLVGRDGGLRLYRRVLLEARRNDLVLDAGEAAILGVLRHELEIRPVEHFLLEHHSDFSVFWGKEHAFLDEMNALRSYGLVFGHAGNVLLAEEVVPLVRQALGIEMPTSHRRRLYTRISGGELGEILKTCRLKASGTRDERLERLVESYVQPSEALRTLSLQVLRDLARDLRTSISGSKDELIDRIVGYFLHGLDLDPGSEAPVAAPPAPEPRTLEDGRFRALFASLKGDELSDILAAIESSRITGAKDTKVAILAESPYCEASLLGQLTNRSLEEILFRHRLKGSGAKYERVERLIEYFRDIPQALLDQPVPECVETSELGP